MSVDQAAEAAQTIGATMDIPGALTRTAVSGAGRGTAIEDTAKLASDILPWNKGPKATFGAPTGGEVMDQYGLLPEGNIAGPVAGFTAELAMDPTIMLGIAKMGIKAAMRKFGTEASEEVVEGLAQQAMRESTAPKIGYDSPIHSINKELPPPIPGQGPPRIEGTEIPLIGERGPEVLGKGTSKYTPLEDEIFDVPMSIDTVDPTVGMGGKGVLRKISIPFKRVFRNPERNQTIKAIKKYTTPSGLNDKKLNFDEIGMQIVQDDLTRYINKPSRLVEVLKGKKVTKEVINSPAGKKWKTSRSGGKIGEVSDELGKMFDGVASYGHGDVSAGEIAHSQLSKYMRENRDKVSAIFRDDKELIGIAKNLSGVLGGKNARFSIKELYELRKNISKQVNSKAFFAAPSDKVAQQVDTLKDLSRGIDDIIKSKLDSVSIGTGKGKTMSAGTFYEVQNSRLHNYLSLSDLAETYFNKHGKDPDAVAGFLGLASEMGIWGGAGAAAQMMGVPYGIAGGAAIGVARGASRAVGKKVRESSPSFLARGLDKAGRAPEMLMKSRPYGAAATRTFSNQEQERDELRGRGPDSMRPAITGRHRGPQSEGNLPLALSTVKMPRTVEGILENKEIIKAKMAQQAPDHLEHVNFILEQRPEDVEQILPMLMEMMPHAFETDKYNRVDNKVMDPMMMEKARHDIMQDEELSNGQRIKLINKMNRTNVLEEY
jgi:hypothetical protein